MKPHKPTILVLAIGILTLFTTTVMAAPLGTAFTYQGRLASGTNAANGSYDLKFSLYDALSSGSQVGSSRTNTATAITNGYFTVTLDFGSVFDGNARWLEIGVRTNGSGAFTTLTPRQALTPTPYSLFASNTATLGGQAPGYYAPASGSTAYVAKSGDTMTGTLNLPANGLVAGGNQLVMSSGNVGIGTPSPTRRLQAAETTAGSLTYPLKVSNEGDTANTAVGLLFQADTGGDRGKGALVYERKDTWNRGDFHFLQNSATNSTIVGINNAVMTIANNGKVGIGTTTPQAALDIRSSDPIFTGVDLKNQTTAPGWNGYRLQVVGSDVTGREGNLEIWKNGVPDPAFNVFTAQPGGNVGIGTTSPQAALDINKSSGDAAIRLTSGASWPLVLSQSPTSDFTITNGGQPRMTIRPDGNVGIGTTAPAAKLHVAGDAEIDGNLAYAGLGGVNWVESPPGLVAFTEGQTKTLVEFGVLKPAAGFLVITATVNVSTFGSFSIEMYDVTSGETSLGRCSGYSAGQTLQLTKVVPVSAGGYINLKLKGYASEQDATVWNSQMTAMFFPRRLN